MPSTTIERAPRELDENVSLLGFLLPNWRGLLIGLVAVAAQTFSDLLEPWPLKIVLDSVLRAKKIPDWLENTVSSIFGHNTLAILEFAAVAVIFIAIIGAVGTYVEKQTITAVGQRVMHELRRAVYWHIQRLSMSYHDNKRTGEVISTVTTDIDAIQSAVTSGVLDGLYYLLMLVGMIGVMFYLDWRFTLIALSVMPPLFIVVYTFTRRIKKASRDLRKKEAEIVSTLQEVLSSIRIVKAFGREEYEQRRFEAESIDSVELALKARNIKAKLSPTVEVIVACGTALVLWFGGRQALEGELTPGVLVVFLLYLGKMYKPMRELSKMSDTFSRAWVGWERIRDFLKIELQIRDLPGARPAPRLQGAINFENVTFAYTPDRLALKNISFETKPGALVAIVGATGSGKTTLISLIPRFYDPQSGVIRIDGTDIRRFQRRTLRQQISFVLQETLLFRASVWQNIAYGDPAASRTEILRAAELANADEFIRQMPQGYDTVVGERGVTLSGGQRQRIAIARAIVRNSPLLILDEPTTGLDAVAEKLVLEALHNLMRGKTTIMIAHRLSAIRSANLILVLEAGEICERGTHEELLAIGGRYANFYNLQARQEEEEAAAAANPLLGGAIEEVA